MNTRRNFFKLAATGVVAAGMSGNVLMASSKKMNYKNKPYQFNIGMAGFTLRDFTVDEALAYLNKLKIEYLSVKDFHLPLNSSQQQINEFLSKAKALNVNVYTVGVIYMKTEKEVSDAFEYAQKVGVTMIVGAPNYNLLSLAEKKVKDTNIRLALYIIMDQKMRFTPVQKMFTIGLKGWINAWDFVWI